MLRSMYVYVLLTLAAASLIASAAGCARHRGDELTEVMMGGDWFGLQVALSPRDHERGLSGRESLGEREGMLFVFDSPQYAAFVMRDCVIPLDLVFLDGDARVIGCARMEVEPPRGAGEERGDPRGDAAYEARLPVYVSSEPASFAIEVRAGTVQSLRIARGDLVTLPAGIVAGHAEGGEARCDDDSESSGVQSIFKGNLNEQ